ncbi:unnamed protein product [Linum trigynum]|uniref:Uncharacterized protein n=1 Tax=Linum trigynum TaxID=586398 RepID=A0AAV2G3Z4_9ROSI
MELDKVLEQEAMMWFQRACENWVKFGERNTSYFHQLTKIRHRSNRVESLKDENGEWVNDKHQLAVMVFYFYSKLYLQNGTPAI